MGVAAPEGGEGGEDGVEGAMAAVEESGGVVGGAEVAVEGVKVVEV